jgi:DNA processing protein
VRRRGGHFERVRVSVPGQQPSAIAGETGVLPALELGGNEQKVYDALNNEESSIDEVIRRSGLPSSAVSVALLGLEMKRVVKQLPGKLFVRNQ